MTNFKLLRISSLLTKIPILKFLEKFKKLMEEFFKEINLANSEAQEIFRIIVPNPLRA